MRTTLVVPVLAAALLLTAASEVARAATVPADWLVISEVMANPAAVSDSVGEWFELTNLGHLPLNLNRLTIADDGGASHQIDVPGNQLLLNPGEFMVFGRSGDSASNGGYQPDYVYSSFSLSNSADQVRILEDGEEVARLDYASGFVQAGASTELGRLPALLENYLPAVTAFGAGDLGTPGLAGQFSDVPAVPLPASLWMMLTATAVFARVRRAPPRRARQLQAVRLPG